MKRTHLKVPDGRQSYGQGPTPSGADRLKEKPTKQDRGHALHANTGDMLTARHITQFIIKLDHSSSMKPTYTAERIQRWTADEQKFVSFNESPAPNQKFERHKTKQ